MSLKHNYVHQPTATQSIWLPIHCIYFVERDAYLCLIPGGGESKAKNALGLLKS